MVTRGEGMAATRQRIIEAALKLALEQAYEDITLIAIAEAAGVSHQTVLNHFESKEKVAAAAAELLNRQTLAARGKAVPADARVRSQFCWVSMSGLAMPAPGGLWRPNGSARSLTCLMRRAPIIRVARANLL